jgi:hypothetical protein
MKARTDIIIIKEEEKRMMMVIVINTSQIISLIINTVVKQRRILSYCHVTAESRNSGARARNSLLSNGPEMTFPLKQ